MLNADQEKAKTKIFQFLSQENPNKIFLLEGPAGTGKTFLITHIFKQMRGKIACAAPTNKALSVLQMANPFRAYYKTIHGLLGIYRSIDERGNINFDLEECSSEMITEFNYIIIDEASMISNVICVQLENMINTGLSQTKLIYCGDKSQLPPVNEPCSSVFSRNYPGYSLSKIERTKKDDIVSYCNSIRLGVKPPKTKNQNIRIFKDEKLWLNEFMQGYSGDSIVLAYTNKRVNYINSKVRAHLFKDNKKYNPGEKIVFKNFYTNDHSTHYTSQLAYIETVGTIRHTFPTLDPSVLMNIKLGTEINKLKTKDEPLKDPCPICYEKDVDKVAETPCGHQFCESCIRLWIERNDSCPMCRMRFENGEILVKDQPEVSALINKFREKTLNFNIQLYQLIIAKDNSDYEIVTIHEDSEKEYKQMLKDMEDIIQRLRNTIYKVNKRNTKFNKIILLNLWTFYHEQYRDILADIDYGYALTIHKSQGSTYDNVFFDLKNALLNKNELKSLIYTGVSRASEKLMILK